MKNWKLIIPCAIIVIELCLYWRQRHELLELKNDVELATLVGSKEQKLQQIKRKLASVERETKQNEPLGTGTFVRAATPEEMRTFQRKKAIEESHEFQRLKTLRQRLTVEDRYWSLFEKLDLDEHGRAGLLQLLLDKENFSEDMNASLTADHGRDRLGFPDIAFMRTAIATAKAQLETAFRQTLGDQGYALYADYLKHLPQHVAVNELGQTLASTDRSLTKYQRSALSKVMGQAERKTANVPTSIIPMPQRELGQSQISGQHFLMLSQDSYTDAFSTQYSTFVPSEDDLANAASVLSPQQMAALRELRDIHLARIEMGKLFYTP